MAEMQVLSGKDVDMEAEFGLKPSPNSVEIYNQPMRAFEVNEEVKVVDKPEPRVVEVDKSRFRQTGEKSFEYVSDIFD